MSARRMKRQNEVKNKLLEMERERTATLVKRQSKQMLKLLAEKHKEFQQELQEITLQEQEQNTVRQVFFVLFFSANNNRYFRRWKMSKCPVCSHRRLQRST